MDYRGSRSAELRAARNAVRYAKQQVYTGNVGVEDIATVNTTAAHREVKPNEVPIHGNERTYNIQEMLANNIYDSTYYHSICEIIDFNAIVDEIYNQVDHVEPWSVGTSRIPSSAFCLLMRLLNFRVTHKQLSNLMNHKDSPYIRCIGFLYLRYAYNPKNIFDWLVDYLDDPEEFSPGGDKKYMITIGNYCKKLLDEPKYHDSMLPRIPVLVQREVREKLMLLEMVKEKNITNERYRKNINIGFKSRGMFTEDNNWYNCKVTDIFEDGMFEVTYDPPYGNVEVLPIGRLDMKPLKESPSSPERGGSRRQSRSRSRNRDSDETDIKELVRRREREKAAAIGRNYAEKPGSYKKSLSLNIDRFTSRRRSRSRSLDRGKRYGDSLPGGTGDTRRRGTDEDRFKGSAYTSSRDSSSRDSTRRDSSRRRSRSPPRYRGR